jgi:hypothetical protein
LVLAAPQAMSKALGDEFMYYILQGNRWMRLPPLRNVATLLVGYGWAAFAVEVITEMGLVGTIDEVVPVADDVPRVGLNVDQDQEIWRYVRPSVRMLSGRAFFIDYPEVEPVTIRARAQRGRLVVLVPWRIDLFQEIRVKGRSSQVTNNLLLARRRHNQALVPALGLA